MALTRAQRARAARNGTPQAVEPQPTPEPVDTEPVGTEPVEEPVRTASAEEPVRTKTIRETVHTETVQEVVHHEPAEEAVPPQTMAATAHAEETVQIERTVQVEQIIRVEEAGEPMQVDQHEDVPRTETPEAEGAKESEELEPVEETEEVGSDDEAVQATGEAEEIEEEVQGMVSADKGKAVEQVEDRASPEPDSDSDDSSSESESDSSDGSDSDSESDEEMDADQDEEISQEFLDSLLAKAKRNLAGKTSSAAISEPNGEEEVIRLEDENTEAHLPPLDPGKLPTPYIDLSDNAVAGPSKIRVRDLDVEQADKITATKVPTAPAPPPSAQPVGKPLTKKERKALKTKTAGKSWYDLPAPSEADLPKLYREVEALRLRNQLDPKRFYRKDEGESKGIKGLPKYFAIGTIVAEPTPFASSNPANLAKSERKRTLVDELVDDAEAKSYAKKKFKELQTVRGARGRGTLAKKMAGRKPKW